MTIKEELTDQLKDAMRAKDRPRLDAIRQVETEASTKRAEPGFEVGDEDEFYKGVIEAYVKRLSKSQVEYEGLGERGAEMVAKLSFEIDYLRRWLPVKLDEAQTRDLVRGAIDELGADQAKGQIIGSVMKARDDLDGALVARLVAEELS